MKNARTALGLVLAVLAAVVVWWVQGDGGLDRSAGPEASSSASACETGAGAFGADPESGLPWIAVEDLPAEAGDTLALIDGDGPYPHVEDDGTFGNFEAILPDEQRGYYREYTVETPGVSHRGARRIVTGAAGELYWTEDHYNSFERIAR